MNWKARQRFYVDGAHPADRIMGCPCGCLLIIRKADVKDEEGAIWLQSETFFVCLGTARSENGPELITAAFRKFPHAEALYDATVAATYYWTETGDERGWLWQ